MNKTDHYLTIVAEECAEIAQEAAKCLRFGIDDVNPKTGNTNISALVYEFNDLVGIMEMLGEEGFVVRDIRRASSNV